MTRTTLTRVLRPVVDTSLVPTWDGAVWIGELDRAELHGAGHRDAIGLAGADGYSRARLLVRDRGEPVGFVEAEVTDRRRIGPSIELRTLERAVRHMPTPERRPAADQALPSVTVVLCTDGDAGETMRSVLAQRGVALDVVVVSAGADGDGRTEIAGRTVTTVPAPTGGLAAARNAGLLAATGDVVTFLGSGTVVDPDWAAAIAAPFVLDDDVACVTGLVPTAEIRTPAQRWHDEHTPAARTIRRRVFRLGDEPGDTPLHPFAAAAYGTGANLAVRRRAALSIGGFDTAFGPGTRVGGGDDLDLFTRLLFAGSAIAVEPAAIAWVRPADDTSSLRRTAAAHGHGLGAWMTKNALDRDTVAATVDSVPEAIAAFARLGLEQGDAVTELGGGSGRRAAGRPAVAAAASGVGAGAGARAGGARAGGAGAGAVAGATGSADGVAAATAGPALAGVEEAWNDTSRRLRRVERRSVLVAPFLALAERLGGAGTIDRTRHGRHELATVAPAPVLPGAMGPAARLTAAGLVVVTLLVAAVGAAFDLPVVRGSAIGVFLFAVVGVAPMLLLRPMPLARFALFAVTTSIVGTIAIGYTMATAGLWAPAVPFAAVVLLVAVAVAAAVPRDLRDLHRQRLERAAAGGAERRWTWTTTGTVTSASLVGLLVVVVTAITHVGDPVPDGLFGSLGIGLPIGLAIVVAAAVVALVRGRGVALPVVVLGGVVQLAQAITYGMPTVMAAARHVGVLEYIRQFGRTDPAADIFQTWSGLFAGGAWVADVGGIVNAMTIAAWVPVLLAFSTTIGVGVLAAHWLPGARRPWIAAFLTAMTGSLNTTYFSPQSTGILLSVAILVLATGALRRVTVTGEDGEPTTIMRPQPVGLSRLLGIGAISIVLAVTHQISPYLTVAAIVVLVVFRMLRPWWVSLVVLVPAVVFALLNGSILDKFLSLAAVGQVLTNVQPPSHDMTVLPKPLVTRLAFDVPAAALVVLGLAAIVTVLLRRDRVHWGLLLAAASPISLLVATNYGQEGIFRVVLFATPWIAVLAAGLPVPGGRFASVGRLVTLAGRPVAVRFVAATALIAGMVAVGSFGQTALDWNRVPTRSQSEATQYYDATAPKGSIMLLTGSANAVPSNTGARYFDVGALSREAFGAYPASEGYDATADVSNITRKLVSTWSATKYYALVAAPFGAYDERYGYQSDADYRKLAAAMADSPYWTPVWSKGTTVVYELTTEGMRHAAR
ncbi:glycosyltransferase family 2 protein [Curtobacterium sp. 458]|uniref:glycosyltransferase n=1 Tax=Curtobacterium sp. 458 TaxID=3050069 RepID=UPI0025B4CBF7|nr:glycosyltransferase family 2 protein [Curtobacterium sp. 458]WJX99013.1 glycosyltransferase family 2 protein [Curtobacterium sp. 458]